MEKVLSSKLFKDNTPAPGGNVDVNGVSRISEGTSVKGDIVALSDIRVDGTVEGKIISKGRVVIGENAVIKGSLLSVNLDLWGKVDGEIYVRDVFTVKSTSEITGSINVRKFQVEMGARINGTFKMITEADYDRIAGNPAPARKPDAQKSATEQ